MRAALTKIVATVAAEFGVQGHLFSWSEAAPLVFSFTTIRIFVGPV